MAPTGTLLLMQVDADNGDFMTPSSKIFSLVELILL